MDSMTSTADETAQLLIDKEMNRAEEKWGRFNSMHEAYAILKEEVEEFWDTVKQDKPDIEELIQVAAVAKRIIRQHLKEGTRIEGGEHETDTGTATSAAQGNSV